ncbi:MFS transporter [Agromyces endophyticus]|uniref:MFS transporter n=1 Tax=Agromyces sp. H17E-10 TaxID=2932244 RepID=UPI001FD50793|nr:MFS transporter [Agromyces sp. H17E-10]UOQ90509.1 MFS transporter [Agromyces sp. H17E-10]
MSEPNPESRTEPTPLRHRWRMLGLLGIAQLMLIVDVTVVALALPQMGAQLDLSRGTLTWVVSIYALVFGGLMLLGGKAADVVGSRGVVLTGLAVFTAASLLTGFATDATMVLVGRALQGLGAAAMSPAALSVIARTFQGDELAKALGVWSALGGAGAAIGVLLGGLLTSGPGWSWVFWVNVPVGVVLLVALAVTVPVLPGSGGRLDVLGALLVTLSTGAVIFGLVNAGDTGWLGLGTLGPVVVGLVGYALFVWRQRTARNPLLDLGMLARRPVAAGLGLIFVATALMIAIFFLGSFLFQQVHGFSALDTGLVFIPVALGTIAGAQVGARLLVRLGLKLVGVVSLLIAAFGMIVGATTMSMTVLVIAMTVASFGIGATFVAASTSTFTAVAPHEAGVGSGALSTLHEFGAATGVSAVSSIAAAAIAGDGFTAFSSGYWFAGAVALVAAVVFAFVLPGRVPFAGVESAAQ